MGSDWVCSKGEKELPPGVSGLDPVVTEHRVHGWLLECENGFTD